MRQWSTPAAPSAAGTAAWPGLLADVVDHLGAPAFESTLLERLQPVTPAASCSVYRTGRHCAPVLYLSASWAIPDTTRDCWQAYLSGPYFSDRSLGQARATRARPTPPARAGTPLLCHVTAAEMPAEHRQRVYDPHGVEERLSVVHEDAPEGGLFAINLYRHRHQPAFSDRQIADFSALAPVLLALTRKHIDLQPRPAPIGRPVTGPDTPPTGPWMQRLRAQAPGLTPREAEVCIRILQGMTHDGIAADLGLGLPTVKTYRNRAFARLGIHFRNELFALVLQGAAH